VELVPGNWQQPACRQHEESQQQWRVANAHTIRLELPLVPKADLAAPVSLLGENAMAAPAFGSAATSAFFSQSPLPTGIQAPFKLSSHPSWSTPLHQLGNFQ
jgi:hypothetical protein